MANLVSTEGLVLSVVPFKETSIIAKIFTKELGLKRYVINSVRTQAPKYPPGFFQSLAYLKLVVYNSPTKEINRIKEVHLAQVWNSASGNSVRTTILMFLGEVLEQCLRDEIAQPALFDFLTTSLLEFERASENEALNFHWELMIHLLPYLGFSPKDEGELLELSYSDLKAFQLPPISEKEEAAVLSCLQKFQNEEITIYNLSNLERRNLIKRLCAWYSFHLEGFGPIRSLEVLRTILE